MLWRRARDPFGSEVIQLSFHVPPEAQPLEEMADFLHALSVWLVCGRKEARLSLYPLHDKPDKPHFSSFGRFVWFGMTLWFWSSCCTIFSSLLVTAIVTGDPKYPITLGSALCFSKSPTMARFPPITAAFNGGPSQRSQWLTSAPWPISDATTALSPSNAASVSLC